MFYSVNSRELGTGQKKTSCEAFCEGKGTERLFACISPYTDGKVRRHTDTHHLS